MDMGQPQKIVREKFKKDFNEIFTDFHRFERRFNESFPSGTAVKKTSLI